jgi:hypothetical protein
MTKGKKGKHKHLLMIAAILAVVIVVSASVGAYIYTTQKSSKNSNGAYVTITVQYANGVTDTYTQQNVSKGMQLSLLYNGQAVSEWYTNLYVTPTWTLGVNSAGVTDSINSWSLTGTYDEVLTSSSVTTYSSAISNYLTEDLNIPSYPLWTSQGSVNLPGGVPETQPVLTPGGSTATSNAPSSTSSSLASNPSPGSGAAIQVAGCSINSQQLQSLYSGWVVGQVYDVYDSFSGSVTINFAQAGAVTQSVESNSGASTIWGMFQVEYTSTSSFTVTGAFAYS